MYYNNHRKYNKKIERDNYIAFLLIIPNYLEMTWNYLLKPHHEKGSLESPRIIFFRSTILVLKKKQIFVLYFMLKDSYAHLLKHLIIIFLSPKEYKYNNYHYFKHALIM